MIKIILILGLISVLMLLITIIFYTKIEKFETFPINHGNENKIIEEKNENRELIKSDVKYGVVKPTVVLYFGMYRTFDITFEQSHLHTLKQITNNDLDSCIVGMHTWDKNDQGEDNPEQPNELMLTNIKNIKYTKTPSPCLNIEIKKQKFVCLWKLSASIALKNAEELYIKKFGIEMPENQPIFRIRYDVILHENHKPLYFLLDENNLPLNEHYILYVANNGRPPEYYEEFIDHFWITNKMTLKTLTEDSKNNFLNDNHDRILFPERALYIWIKSYNIKSYYIGIGQDIIY